MPRAAGERPGELRQREVARGAGLGLDQVGHRFGLREVERPERCAQT